MSLSRYTNIDELNNRLTNEGQFLKKEDLFVISQNEKEESKFGECESDILEFSVYDINNNIITQSNNSTATYIRGINQINEYLIKTDTNEFAVDIEKLLTNAGFSNGIFKVNLKFLRQRVGDNSEYRKAFIQEISSTRQEIRILPLKVQSSNSITVQNFDEIEKLQKLDVDYNTYTSHINKVLNESGESIVAKANEYVEKRFEAAGGINTFDQILREDFLISDGFSNTINSIYSEIRGKILEELATKTQIGQIDENSLRCGVIPSEQYNQVMIGIIQESITNKAIGSRGANLTDEQSTSTETVAEQIFETKQNIDTNIVRENVQEYTTVDLSDIQLSSENVDNFNQLNQQIIDALKTDTFNTDNTGGTTDGGTTEEPVVTNTPINVLIFTTLKDACCSGPYRQLTLYMNSNLWDTATALCLDAECVKPYYSSTTKYLLPVEGGNVRSWSTTGLKTES